MTVLPIRWIPWLLPLVSISFFQEGQIFGGIITAAISAIFFTYKFGKR